MRSASFLALTGWFIANVAFGANTAEQAISGMNPLGSSCRRETQRISALPLATKARTPAAAVACGIDPQSAADARGQGAVVVDSRGAMDFEAFHIDGSLNFGAAGIKTKAFLQHKKLLLVGSGKAEEMLFDACEQLRADGFASVHVIRGGMPAWLQHALPVIGKAPSATDMITLSPSELMEESSNRRNRIFLTLTGGALKEDIPTAVSVLGDDVNSMAAAARAVVPADGTAIFASSVGALPPQKIASLVTAMYPMPVLVYLHGRNAYKATLSTQKTVWAAQARGPKTLPCSVR